jgi:hypothetical protein
MYTMIGLNENGVVFTSTSQTWKHMLDCEITCIGGLMEDVCFAHCPEATYIRIETPKGKLVWEADLILSTDRC